MATLETIPEEPTATPPNSPTPARVTADPPKTKPAKNPKRVAAGKKLAERNRRVREVLEQMKQEEDEEAAAPTDTTANGSGLSLVAVLGISGLIVSLLGLYYQREAIMASLKPAPPPQPAPAPTPAPSRIPVKRGIKEMEGFSKHPIYHTSWGTLCKEFLQGSRSEA